MTSCDSGQVYFLAFADRLLTKRTLKDPIKKFLIRLKGNFHSFSFPLTHKVEVIFKFLFSINLFTRHPHIRRIVGKGKFYLILMLYLFDLVAVFLHHFLFLLSHQIKRFNDYYFKIKIISS